MGEPAERIPRGSKRKVVPQRRGGLLGQSGGKPDRHTERPHVAHLHRGTVPAVLRLGAEAPPHYGAGLPRSRRTVGHISASQPRARQRHDLPLIRLPRRQRNHQSSRPAAILGRAGGQETGPALALLKTGYFKIFLPSGSQCSARYFSAKISGRGRFSLAHARDRMLRSYAVRPASGQKRRRGAAVRAAIRGRYADRQPHQPAACERLPQ